MAFDGITIAAMVQELHKNLDNGRFNKIAQPESDALMITGKGMDNVVYLYLPVPLFHLFILPAKINPVH